MAHVERRHLTVTATTGDLRRAGALLRASGDQGLVTLGEQIREALRPGGPPMPWCIWCLALHGRRRRAAWWDQGTGAPTCPGCAAEGLAERRGCPGEFAGGTLASMRIDDPKPEPADVDAGDEPLREEDVTRGDVLDDRVEEGDGLPEGD